MEDELKTAWITELRSGRWKQTTGRLRGDGNKRCCLGVLCELLPNVEQAEQVEQDNLYGIPGALSKGYKLGITFQDTALPRSTGTKLGSVNAELAYGHLGSGLLWDLTGANDKGSSPEETADTIEAHDSHDT